MFMLMSLVMHRRRGANILYTLHFEVFPYIYILYIYNIPFANHPESLSGLHESQA